VLVAVATRAEGRLLAQAGDDLHVVRVGPALRYAHRITTAAHDAPVTGLVSFGFAGGLDPRLHPGTIILPRHIRRGNERIAAVDREWQARVVRALRPQGCCEGDLLAADAVVWSARQKRRLGAGCSVTAVDLESAGLAEIAASLHLPFLVFRVVLDAAADELPAGTERLVSDSGTTRVTSSMLAFAKSPAPFLRLLRRYRHARSSMRGVLALAMPELLRPTRTAPAVLRGTPGTAQAGQRLADRHRARP
jgi:nucleoside phosphorylase